MVGKQFLLWLVGVCCLVYGCGRQSLSLEDEISARPPDEWGFGWQLGASSNNYAILDRIMLVSDVLERIRLVRCAYEHFWHAPEWFLTNRVDRQKEPARFMFIGSCSSRLIFGSRVTPETISAGWKMKAEFLDDIEKYIQMTDRIWSGGCQQAQECEGGLEQWNLIYYIHREYEMFFKYQFLGCVTSYRQLAPSYRPSFVKQIKRDFFHRAGMKYVDTRKFPREFFE